MDLLLTHSHLDVPSGNTQPAPPTRSSEVGPVSLWLPADSSDQFGACGSMPPRRDGWLGVAVIPGACGVSSVAPSPLQAVVIKPHRVVSVKAAQTECGGGRIRSGG